MSDGIEFWVIMDNEKKAIACGSPRNRSMRMLSSLDKSKIRVLLYGSRAKAVAGFSNGNGFYDETYIGTGKNPYETYLTKTYGRYREYENICIPVKVTMVINESNDEKEGEK